jgi:hypothetical protein
MSHLCPEDASTSHFKFLKPFPFTKIEPTRERELFLSGKPRSIHARSSVLSTLAATAPGPQRAWSSGGRFPSQTSLIPSQTRLLFEKTALARGFYMRRTLMLTCLFGLCFALAQVTWGDPIHFSGTGTWGGDFDNFTFAGHGLSLEWATPIGPGFVLETCSYNTVCNITTSAFTAGSEGFFGPVYNSGSFKGAMANTLFGELTFFGFASLAPFTGTETVDVPVTFSGEITGEEVACVGGIGPCGVSGPVEFQLLMSGQGTADLFFGGGANGAVLESITYDFTGTARPTPEPGTLLLLGGGMLSLAPLVRRTRRI